MHRRCVCKSICVDLTCLRDAWRALDATLLIRYLCSPNRRPMQILFEMRECAYTNHVLTMRECAKTVLNGCLTFATTFVTYVRRTTIATAIPYRCMYDISHLPPFLIARVNSYLDNHTLYLTGTHAHTLHLTGTHTHSDLIH